MNPDTYFFKLCDGGADVDGVTAQAIKLGDDQHISLLHTIQQFGKPLTLGDGHRAGDNLGDDAMWLNSKASRFDFLDLVFGRLVEGGDAGVCKSSRHRAIRYEIGVRNYSYVL